ncbi:MAG: hypothetical protein ACRDRI_13105 [Pseudonocardiaceae bacterium]
MPSTVVTGTAPQLEKPIYSLEVLAVTCDRRWSLCRPVSCGGVPEVLDATPVHT